MGGREEALKAKASAEASKIGDKISSIADSAKEAVKGS
jgi:hypothetical protein